MPFQVGERLMDEKDEADEADEADDELWDGVTPAPAIGSAAEVGEGTIGPSSEVAAERRRSCVAGDGRGAK